MTVEHTATPWQADDGDGYYFGIFASGNGEPIAYLVEPSRSCKVKLLPLDENSNSPIGQHLRAKEHRANAEFIVRACNAHDDLVAQLKIARSLLARRARVDASELKAMDAAIANAGAA